MVGFVSMTKKPHMGNFTHFFQPTIMGSRAVVSKDTYVANDHFHFVEFEAYGEPPMEHDDDL